MTTLSGLMTLEQYLRSGSQPDADFVDGVIRERMLGEREHGRLQGLIFACFLSREKQHGTYSVVEHRVRVAGSRVRVCDVTVLGPDAPDEEVALTPPLICVEILSPQDRLARAEEVLADYLLMGVKNIWAAYFYDNAGLHKAPENVLTTLDAAITLDMEEIFDSLESAAERT